MDEQSKDIQNEAVPSFQEKLKAVLRFDEQNWLNNLPLLLFIGLLGVLHVANNHTAENKIRRMNALEHDIKELRWLYMTSKAELMYNSEQSEVAKMVSFMGLKELTKPAYQIEVDKDEY